MERFDRGGLRRFRARDAVLACASRAVDPRRCSPAPRSARPARRCATGIGRAAVLAVGDPAGWIADRLPLHHAAHDLTAWLSPDVNLSGPAASASRCRSHAPRACPPVTPDAFSLRPTSGVRRRAAGHCSTLLVTGDSMSQPLDQDLAQRLAPQGVARHPRPAHRHRDLRARSSSTGASSPPTRSPRTTPTRWSCSSAPTTATRCRPPPAARSSAAAPRGRRSTPTACVR